MAKSVNNKVIAILNSLSIDHFYSSNKFRPFVEITLELLFVAVYIWVIERTMPSWFRAVFLWGVCVLFPIICIAIEQKSFPEFTLDWQAAVKSAKMLFLFTLPATLLLVTLALSFQTFNYDGQMVNRVSEYVFWAFLQQLGFQTFLTKRVQSLNRNPYQVAFISSSLFALLHFPNPALVVFTWVGGFFWAYIYQKAPNLFLLALSHGWLAVIALYCAPKSWLHGLRIGPTYWDYQQSGIESVNTILAVLRSF